MQEEELLSPKITKKKPSVHFLLCTKQQADRACFRCNKHKSVGLLKMNHRGINIHSYQFFCSNESCTVVLTRAGVEATYLWVNYGCLFSHATRILSAWLGNSVVVQEKKGCVPKVLSLLLAGCFCC